MVVGRVQEVQEVRPPRLIGEELVVQDSYPVQVSSLERRFSTPMAEEVEFTRAAARTARLPVSVRRRKWETPRTSLVASMAWMLC